VSKRFTIISQNGAGNMRSSPQAQFIKREVAAGHLGAITRMRHTNGHSGALGGWFDTEWRWITEIVLASGGGLADLNLNILDAIYRGKYSPAFLKRCGADRPLVQKGDFDLISLLTDYLGLNVYTGQFVRAGDDRKPEVLPFPKTILRHLSRG
jgi:hypothetical protein